MKANQRLAMLFVDNLPKHVTKRFLYWEFGRYGSVVDVYISRKKRKTKSCPFAFIRYDAYGGAVRAREGLHGSFMVGKPITVKVSMYERTSMRNTDGGIGIGVDRKKDGRIFVMVNASEKQKDLLDRSIIAESFELIKFGYVVESLKNFDEVYGKIECRDLGPRKCILTCHCRA
ncbi:hypothetical protein PIB30_061104 [Stylosanthes scabra]|uniref:RRM domain-containing protein n=1 Tax=Stylosanthes scabra TaxID=79078 RepID=A0ABU6WKT0_9FABA|nr:hypothetical protein [Stylosanthes scabra]